MLQAAAGPQVLEARGSASPLTAPLHLPGGVHQLDGVEEGLQCVAARQARHLSWLQLDSADCYAVMPQYLSLRCGNVWHYSMFRLHPY